MINVYNQKRSKQKGPNPRKTSGKSNNKLKGKCDYDRDTDVKYSDNINDPSYYFTDETLKNQIATISFNQFAGVPFNIGTKYDGTKISKTGATIMRINLNPSAGFTRGVGVQNSSNLAALSLFTKLSANNAKTSQYGPQDLTTMIFALGEIISLSSHIARAFGVARLFNYRNRSYPKHVLTAMGVDYDDLIENFANYRSRYNLAMVTASQIPIPANIPYLMKSKEIYSGLYLDMEGSSMAQTYVFTPATSWYLNEAAEGGTSLNAMAITSDATTVNKLNILLGYLETAIQDMLESTTLNAVYSDVLRVADKEGMQLYTFTTIPDDYVVVPTYNPEVRKWINNLTVMGRPLDEPQDGYTAGNNVYPDPDNNGIKYRPQFRLNSGFAIDPIINFDSGNASVDDIVEATRLTSSYTMIQDGGYFVTGEVALPDHYVTELVIYEGGVASGLITGTSLQFQNSSEPSVAFNTMTTIAGVSNFDWAPTLYLSDVNYALYDIIQDLNYYTTLEFSYLARLQDATYFGLLSIR